MFRKEIVWGVNAAWSAIVIVMALAKFFEIAMIVEMFRGWGLRPYLSSIGLIELISVLLYLYPPTMRAGFFLLCSFFGGAMAITLSRGDNILPPMLMLAALWGAAYLRGPHLYKNEEVRTSQWDYLRSRP